MLQRAEATFERHRSTRAVARAYNLTNPALLERRQGMRRRRVTVPSGSLAYVPTWGVPSLALELTETKESASYRQARVA